MFFVFYCVIYPEVRLCWIKSQSTASTTVRPVTISDTIVCLFVFPSACVASPRVVGGLLLFITHGSRLSLLQNNPSASAGESTPWNECATDRKDHVLMELRTSGNICPQEAQGTFAVPTRQIWDLKTSLLKLQ